MAKTTKAEDLLRVLGARTTPHSPVAVQPTVKEFAAPEKQPDKPSSSAAKQIKGSHDEKRRIVPSYRGRAVQFYLHPEDEQLIREYVVWLAPHRKRINDTLIIKTVLRAAKTGSEFLVAYDKAVKVDGRLKRKQ